MMIGSISQASNRLKSSHRGFTLIELLITIVIIGILAAIVIPAYNSQVRTTRRSDAISTLLQIAQSLERCRSDTLAYNNATCTAPFPNPVTSPRNHYQITVATTANTFTLTAIPNPLMANNSQANDTQCAVFTLDQAGARTALDSTAAISTVNCWR